jgi:hypothetical protein
MTSTSTPPDLPPPPPFDAPPAPQEPPLTGRKQLSPLAAAVLGLAAGAGVVGGIWAVTANNGTSSPGAFELTGSFSLTEDALNDDDGGCHGIGGYDDITEGASVTVYGAAGAVIATGSLGHSESVAYSTCNFDVSVPDVPKGEKFYKVEVSHRGTVQLSAKEAEAGKFAATLG